MNVTKRQIDQLNVEVTIEVAAADYAEFEHKRLAERRRSAEFKGFRKGMAPMSLIQRVYGDQALADAVNHVVGEQLDEFIKNENLDVLGEPLPTADQPENEWKSGNDFKFVFEMGLRPEISFEVVKEDTVNKYTVTPSAETVAKMKENFKKHNEAQKKEVSDEEVEKEVDENLKRSLANEADWQLTKDIRKMLVEKAAISLPEDFLKRWLIYANSGKVTEEQVEKEFPRFIEDFKWQLVRGYLMKKYDFKVTEQDMFDAAEAYVRVQYTMYGMPEVPEEMVQDAAHRILQDGRQVGNLNENVENQKVLEKVKEEITIKNKKITEEKFRAL